MWKLALLSVGLIVGLGVDAATTKKIRQSPSNLPTFSLSGALTTKWFEGTDREQIIEVTVNNTSPDKWLLIDHNFKLTVASNHVVLVTPGTLKRLRPGQSARVQIGVKSKPGFKPRSEGCSATVLASWSDSGENVQSTTASVSGACIDAEFTADTASLATHTVPQWYEDAKFGIFMHWGLYSAPAFGGIPPYESYAEWYWNAMHSVGSPTYTYHKATYGTAFNYDDFASNFTGTVFNATSLLNLVSDAGAKYFVPVTKHHDGFAIFNFSSSISTRSSVHYGPKRDFIGEIAAAKKAAFPDIHLGTYFSMPEWYNPLYKKYAQTKKGFPGGPPTNPYTGATIPYTGYVDVGDYISGLQRPQMDVLAYTYDTEIMWCDIGGSSDAQAFAAKWYNWAATEGRQVTINNRCGDSVSGDFTTPEYTTNSKIVARKWESNRGMDPFSFGFNYPTPDSKYLHGIDIVQSLVDMVSKNGNFLLDIGPKNDGSVPAIMQSGLRDAGKWIKAHGESIYGTTYWATTPGINNTRYTTTSSAFYIHLMSKPGTSVSIPDPIPYVSGDPVTVLGGSMNGTAVTLTPSGKGFTLNMGAAVGAADQYVWTFKITYK